MPPRLLTSQGLISHNLNVFIPSYKAFRVGIVRDIPQDFDLAEEFEFFYSPLNIIDLHRLNRRVRDGNGYKYVPSRTVCIKFERQLLPKFIHSFRVKHLVTLFILRTKICYSCYRVGHVVKSCRGKPRCLLCGFDKHPDDTVCPSKGSPPKCINCGKDNLATSSSCSFLLEQQRVQSLAASQNIPLFEARERLRSFSSFNYNASSDFNNFSILNSPDPSYLLRGNSFPAPHTSNNFFSPLEASHSPIEAASNTKPSFASILKNKSHRPNSRSLSFPPHPAHLPSNTRISPSYAPPPAGTGHPRPRHNVHFSEQHRELLNFPNGRSPFDSSVPSSASNPGSPLSGFADAIPQNFRSVNSATSSSLHKDTLFNLLKEFISIFFQFNSLLSSDSNPSSSHHQPNSSAFLYPPVELSHQFPSNNIPS